MLPRHRPTEPHPPLPVPALAGWWHVESAPRRRRRPAAVLALALLAMSLVAVACRTTGPTPRRGRPLERGIASWYGPGFQGRATASGETFDTEALTAAHRTLPFGTVVEVVNLDNGHAVRVRINDRGPFVRRRVIDLSRAAAREIDLVRSGVARVELYVVETPGSERFYTVQVAAFTEIDRARELQAELARRYPGVAIHSHGAWHRVQVSRFARRERAERLRRELARDGYSPLVVPLADSTT